MAFVTGNNLRNAGQTSQRGRVQKAISISLCPQSVVAGSIEGSMTTVKGVRHAGAMPRPLA